MLLYKNNHQRNEILTSYINKELIKGHLCIYAPVDPYSRESDTSIHDISAKIWNYHKNIQDGNLQIINMRYYYDCAIRREMEPLKNIKLGLQNAIRNRYKYNKKKLEIVIITDINFSLLQKRYVGQCFAVEEWLGNIYSEYINNNQYIKILCLYPHFLFSSELEGSIKLVKDKLVELHTLTIDVSLDSSILNKY
jgi:hypothetical protein